LRSGSGILNIFLIKLKGFNRSNAENSSSSSGGLVYISTGLDKLSFVL
jgi:hypothetical protein